MLLYLGLEGPVLLRAVFHMSEGCQIVVADDGRLQQTQLQVSELNNEHKIPGSHSETQNDFRKD